MRTFFALMLFVSTVFGQAPSKNAPQQGPPPTKLIRNADGHFTANQDPEDAKEFEVHLVKTDDTLSQIADQALKNSRLWPQLWEQNEHIINPHWIYPNGKILIRLVTVITEARPPQPPAPPAPEPPAAPAPPPAAASNVAPAPVLAPPAPLKPSATPPSGVLTLSSRKPIPEVKEDDLYCSGVVRKSPVPTDLKVIMKFDASNSILASEGEYGYLSQGAEDGMVTGNLYQVVRPTITITDPNGRTTDQRNPGMHYLDIGQLRVVMTRPDFSLARVIRSCDDSIQVGDIMLPFVLIQLPPFSRPRPFRPTMTVRGDIKGSVVVAQAALLNFGSITGSANQVPGVRGGRLGSLERGFASEGAIAYIDAGQKKGVKPGDIFVVFRNVEMDERLYRLPKEAKKLKNARTAIGDVLIVKVGERVSTVLATYAADAVALGDAVERR